MTLLIVEGIIQSLVIVMMCMTISENNDFNFKTKLIDTEQYIKVELANVLFGVMAVLITVITSCRHIATH